MPLRNGSYVGTSCIENISCSYLIVYLYLLFQINCVLQEDVRPMMEVFRKIYNELHNHVVRVKCSESSKSSALTWTQLSQLIIENNSEMVSENKL